MSDHETLTKILAMTKSEWIERQQRLYRERMLRIASAQAEKQIAALRQFGEIMTANLLDTLTKPHFIVKREP